MVITIEQFIQTATDEQKEILFKLYNLAMKERELSHKINTVYINLPNIMEVEKNAITICEDRDDSDVITIGLKKELQDIRSQMSNILIKAVNELGMSDVGIIQRQYKNYVKD